MSTSTQILDETCERFAETFSMPPTIPANNQEAVVDIEPLNLGLSRLALEYRTPEQQQTHFLTANNFNLVTGGSPSVKIRTWTVDYSIMAVYYFDRITGLVIVNNYPFPDDEVRDLGRSDYEDLEFSIATQGITNRISRNRTLTEQGITNLVAILNTVIKEAS